MVTDEAVAPRQDAGGRSNDLAYLTAVDVATLLQLDEKTVLRWSLEDTTMPVLRRGRVVRFPRARLFVWLQRQERRVTQESRKSLAATS